MQSQPANIKIYYADQADWDMADWYTLWRYLNRLAQFVGPNAAQRANPDKLGAQIQARRMGRRDEELAALDLSQMSQKTQHLLKHILIQQKRYEDALTKFPNLESLRRATPPADFIVLADPPGLYHDVFTKARILL